MYSQKSVILQVLKQKKLTIFFLHSVLGTDLGKMGFSITYTKHTDSATAGISDERQGEFLSWDMY